MKIILSILLAFSLAFGVEINEIKDDVAKRVENSIKILNDKSLDENAKQNAVVAQFDPIFDYELMAKISLGFKNYDALNKEEQSAYVKNFSQMLKRIYASRLKDYTDEEFIIDSLEQPKPQRAVLNAHLQSKGKRYDVTYKYYNANERGWLVYDVEIVGVSIVQTYKGQFADVLKNGGINAVIEALKAQ
ncbi:phospholipid-binding protein MlaC [Campylobacter sp. 19-13652]|uniref:MlaC/ttg2D family ABC transporter substrate-binding protein n=1 Tax=Campylobacter sp. 19-13652 TaxID=2840180 RepID=UPI001C783240|nr:ABC transporter substrate-binding protein [Campylobacter sp. 19-13652]BCX78909.1 toluene tolerance protein [Campylobacter sp. 19-13652]